MNYEYILFDLDGTLTDPKVGITKSVAYALNSFGIQVNNLDELDVFIGPPLRDSFQLYYKLTPKETEVAVEKYREYFSVTGKFENAVYQGIPNLLSELKRKGKKLIVATSKPILYSKQILEHFDLLTFFDYVAGSELDGRRSDKEEVILYALNENHIINRAKVLMIGDRKFDILGAKSLNIDSVGVLYGYGDLKEHEDAGATYIVDSVDSLSDLLLR